MIALCRDHHDEADAGRISDDELRELKTHPHTGELKGRFDWMRENLLAVVGGSYCLDVFTPVVVDHKPLIFFNRDDDNHFLLNIEMPEGLPTPAIRVADNFCIEDGGAKEVECAPNGLALGLAYANGDRLRVKFIPDLEPDQLNGLYPGARVDWNAKVPSPVTVVEITAVFAQLGWDFGPDKTQVGTTQVGNSFMSNGWGRHEHRDAAIVPSLTLGSAGVLRRQSASNSTRRRRRAARKAGATGGCRGRWQRAQASLDWPAAGGGVLLRPACNVP